MTNGSSYVGKYLRISSYIRKPFPINDFATAPLWISLYMKKIFFSFLSVHIKAELGSEVPQLSFQEYIVWCLVQCTPRLIQKWKKRHKTRDTRSLCWRVSEALQVYFLCKNRFSVTATHQADSLRLVRVDEASVPSRWPPPVWFGKCIFLWGPATK